MKNQTLIEKLNKVIDLRQIFLQIENPSLTASCLHFLGDYMQFIGSLMELKQKGIEIYANRTPLKKGRASWTIELHDAEDCDGDYVWVCNEMDYDENSATAGYYFLSVHYADYADIEYKHTVDSQIEALKIGIGFANYLLKNEQARYETPNQGRAYFSM
jgi:hypothetical protein